MSSTCLTHLPLWCYMLRVANPRQNQPAVVYLRPCRSGSGEMQSRVMRIMSAQENCYGTVADGRRKGRMGEGGGGGVGVLTWSRTTSGLSRYHAVATGDHLACSLPCPACKQQIKVQAAFFFAPPENSCAPSVKLLGLYRNAPAMLTRG